MEETKKYITSVHGCDDSTYTEMELTQKEFELISKLAEKITEASTYGCMPTMRIVAEEDKQ